jgi:hypothetical protein
MLPRKVQLRRKWMRELLRFVFGRRFSRRRLAAVIGILFERSGQVEGVWVLRKKI